MRENFRVVEEDVDYLVGLKTPNGKFSAVYKAKEDSLGTRCINLVEHEIRGGGFHKLTVHQDDLDPLGDAERTITYEWKD